MNILVVGSGGREHALAWKLAQATHVNQVFVAPGNAGTAHEPSLENVAIDVMDFEALAHFAKERDIGLTVIGPEAPLVAGIVDYFAVRKLPCFGPSQSAAQLEGSKAFTKDFLARHGDARARRYDEARMPNRNPSSPGTAAHQTWSDGARERSGTMRTP